MTPQAIPDGPAPMPVLSSTTTSAPEPRPRARSSLARCHAVESPCTPAPITTNLLLSGTVVTRGSLLPGGTDAEQRALRVGHGRPTDEPRECLVHDPLDRCSQ